MISCSPIKQKIFYNNVDMSLIEGSMWKLSELSKSKKSNLCLDLLLVILGLLLELHVLVQL